MLLRSTVEEADRHRLQAIYAGVGHFSMHTGQIIVLAKMWKGGWRGGKDGD